MKEFFPVKRVVGGSEEEKEEVRGLLAERFREQKHPKLVEGERKKTDIERAIIVRANEVTNSLCERYGLAGFDVPEKNLHIIREKEWKHDETQGMYEDIELGIVMRENPTRLGTAAIMFHELVHMKSYAAVTKEGEDPESYRLGLEIHIGDDPRAPHFRMLNEAVTEELTRRFIGEQREHPLFKDEIDAHLKSAQAVRARMGDEAYAERYPSGTFMSHVVFVGKKPMIEPQTIVYERQRRALAALIDKLYKANPEDFKDRDEVFDLFAKAMFSGQMLPLGRLIEKSFGKKTFRTLGELSITDKLGVAEELLRFIESL